MGGFPSSQKVKLDPSYREEKQPLQYKLRRLWEATTVYEMVREKEVYWLGSDATVLDAARSLTKRNVLSVPIYDTVTKKAIGMFDSRDLVTLLIMCCKHSFSEMTPEEVILKLEEKYKQAEDRAVEHKNLNSSASNNSKSTAQPTDDKSGTNVKLSVSLVAPLPSSSPSMTPASSFVSSLPTSSPAPPTPTSSATPLYLLSKSEKARKLVEYLNFLDVKNAPIQLVMGLSGRNPLFTTHLATPLIYAMGIISPHNAKSVHRVCVLDRKGQMAGILTQSRCFRYIASKIHEWEDFAQSTLRELGLGYRSPPCVGWKETVLQAFTQLEEKNCSLVAIVDENKKLVGTLSVTDVKYLFDSKELLITLQRPVSVFINAVRGSSTFWTVNIDSNSQSAQSHSITLSLDHTLKDAVDIFLKHSIHRIWIVDDKEIPISMVSLADVLRLLVPPPIEKHIPNSERSQQNNKRGGGLIARKK